MNPRILVVGGLAAGPSAASKAKRINPNADVTLVEEGDSISYGICEIPYYLGGVVTDASHLIVYTPETLLKEKGVKASIRHRAEEIRPGGKMLSVRDLDTGKVKDMPYDRLILATGSKPKTLGIAGEQGRNVFFVKSLDGAFALKKFIDSERPQKAVIIGGGYIAMEMAEALTSQGIASTILLRGAQPMSRVDPACRSAIAKVLKDHSVNLIAKSLVTSFVSDASTKVTAVRTTSGDIGCDLVIIAIGVEPNSELAAAAGIKRGLFRGIQTDQRQLTSIDSIYAAGDCCEVRGIVNRAWTYIPLATVASRQGRVAGENAAGGSAVFKGAVRAIGVKIFELHVAQVGLNSDEAKASGFDPVVEHIEGNSRISFFPGNKRIDVIALRDRKSDVILGATVYGEDGVLQRANVLSVAVQMKLTAGELEQLDLLYAPPFSPLWDPVLVLAHQMRKSQP